MTRILVTGFEPFGELEGNSSAAVVTALGDRPPDGVDLATATLPVSFARAWPALRREVEASRPDAVLLLGQAGGRARVEVERIAINVADSAAADNDGDVPTDRPLREGGPDGLFATIPVRGIVDALRAAGTPAAISDSAGTYVCNALLYAALADLDVPVGFIHLPCLPAQVPDGRLPTMALDVAVDAVRTAVGVIARDAGR